LNKIGEYSSIRTYVPTRTTTTTTTKQKLDHRGIAYQRRQKRMKELNKVFQFQHIKGYKARVLEGTGAV
jgi:hypothetical protein